MLCNLLVSPLLLSGLIELDAIDRGFYGNGGGHTPTNTNYIVGDVSTDTAGVTRNFFVFDLAIVDAPIETATLRVFLNVYSSVDPFETWALYDITSPFDVLLTDFGGQEQWEDLGSGVEYGEITLSDDDEGGFISIDLNAAAIDSLNAARLSDIENRWALGGAITTLDNDDSTLERLFPGSASIPLSATQLIVTTIPAPPALVLFSVAALGSHRRRRS